jgi:hypothetical protein
MTRSRPGLLLLLLMLPIAALAKDIPERAQFGRDIRVGAGEKTGDLTCINCSIYIGGEVTGDVSTIHGNITVEPGASVAGDLAAIWGDVRAESGSQISGDIAAVAGGVRRQQGSNVGGDIASLEGGKWLLAIFVPPLVFVGLIVALIVWLVQRNRRRVTLAAASPGAVAR